MADEMPGGEEGFPGAAGMNEQWERGCLPSLLDYTGRDYAEVPDLDTYIATPTEASWAVDDRRLVCWLVDIDLEPVTGSLRSQT